VQARLGGVFRKWPYEKDVCFYRMQIGLDSSINKHKDNLPRGSVKGVFKLRLPFAVQQTYKKTFLGNKVTGARFLHIDMAKIWADADIDENPRAMVVLDDGDECRSAKRSKLR